MYNNLLFEKNLENSTYNIDNLLSVKNSVQSVCKLFLSQIKKILKIQC